VSSYKPQTQEARIQIPFTALHVGWLCCSKGSSSRSPVFLYAGCQKRFFIVLLTRHLGPLWLVFDLTFITFSTSGAMALRSFLATGWAARLPRKILLFYMVPELWKLFRQLLDYCFLSVSRNLYLFQIWGVRDINADDNEMFLSSFFLLRHKNIYRQDSYSQQNNRKQLEAAKK